MMTPIYFISKAVDFVLKHKRLFILLVVALFVGVGISVLCRGGWGPPPRRTDLTVFLRAAEAIQSGENIYNVTNDRGWYYVYLPLLAILLTPFTRLPLLLNTSLWYALSVASLCGAVLLSARLAKDRPTGMRAAVMAALFCIPPMVESMTRGQVGVMSVFLTIAILYLYVQKKTVWTGILFAFSVVLKTSPLAPLVVFFLVKREWKVLIAALAGVLFFAFIFPSLVLGAGLNWSYMNQLHSTLNFAISSTRDQSPLWSQLATPIAWDNQSLYAVFTRWACPTETDLLARGNFLIKWGTRLFGTLALLALAFVSRRKRSDISQKRLMLEYSLFPILMLLVSPVSEIHHYATFFALFFPVFLYLDELPRNSASYQALAWSSLIAGITLALGYSKTVGMWGLPAVGALIFWCVSFIFLTRLKNRE